MTHCLRPNDGQGRVNYEIAAAAARAGHEITLLATEVAADLLALPGVRWVHIPSGPLPTALLRNQVFAVRSWLWLRTHRREIDLLHVNGWITWGTSNVNSVHFVHGGWRKSPYYAPGSGIAGLYQRFYTRINSFLEKRAFERSDAIVAVSRRVAEELIGIGVDQSKIKVIHNGVDIEEFAPGEARRGDLGVPSGVTLAIFAGDISTFRKNLDSVLRALVRVPHVHLAIAGSIKKSPFPEMAERLGIAGRVHFLGHRRDVPVLMKAADLFTFPSRYEACSLVLLEAMASGLPVITARTAGGAELVDSRAGVVIEDPNDIEALVEALDKVTSTPEALREMGVNARNIALSYSWSAMSAKYMNVYENVLSNKKSMKLPNDLKSAIENR